MLNGNKLIVTPVEGGGFVVHEESEPMMVNDMVNAVGSIVVTIAVVGAICWIMDKAFKVILK